MVSWADFYLKALSQNVKERVEDWRSRGGLLAHDPLMLDRDNRWW